MSISYLSKEGYEKLKAELDHMKKVQRPFISSQIAEARDKGDLSENAEYDAAKDAQGLLELKISKAQEVLANCRVMDESQIDTSKVSIFCTVKVLNKKIGKEVSYTIVSESEADLKLRKISSKSAIGMALLGKKVGETLIVNVPAGELELDVLSITAEM